jgi:hypothetical protein
LLGRVGDAPNRGLNLIGDVRNDLHGLPQVIAAALARDDLLVDASAGQVVGLRKRRVREALVVSQIEVGFGAVIGDEYLAMLERAHGSGIYVQVGIEFLKRDLQSAAFEQAPQARRGDAFTQGGNHTASDKYVFGH